MKVQECESDSQERTGLTRHAELQYVQAEHLMPAAFSFPHKRELAWGAKISTALLSKSASGQVARKMAASRRWLGR